MTRTTPLVLEGEAKQAAMDTICAQIAEGKPLAEILREDSSLPGRRTVYDWLRADKGFAEAMDIAREVGADAIAEEALRIADTPMEGVRIEKDKEGVTKEVTEDMLGHRRLQVETRLKLLAKWCKGKYGDRVTAEHVGKDGGPIQTQHTLNVSKLTDEQLRAISSIPLDSE